MDENPGEAGERERTESIDLWKHYDSLRQDKNKTFLATNSILVAAVGFTLKNKETGTSSDFAVLLLVAVVGFLACLLWFVLLSRNKLYIDFHRQRAAAAESHSAHGLPGLDADWRRFEEKAPPWARMSSNDADRVLSLVILSFWTAVVVVSVILLA